MYIRSLHVWWRAMRPGAEERSFGPAVLLLGRYFRLSNEIVSRPLGEHD